MKPCINEDILYRFLNNEIPSEEAGDIQEHLKTCASCRSVLSDMKQITDSLTSRERPPVPKDLLKTYHQELESQFGSQTWFTGLIEWIRKKTAGLTRVRIYTTRIAFGLGLILLGIMMDRFLFHPDMNGNQLSVEQVRLISSLNESDLEILKSFFNDTDRFLESIVYPEQESV